MHFIRVFDMREHINILNLFYISKLYLYAVITIDLPGLFIDNYKLDKIQQVSICLDIEQHMEIFVSRGHFNSQYAS